MEHEPNETYVVREKIFETPTVCTLKLAHSDGSIPAFVPGQFITVYFPELGTPQGKAYSISSAPSEKTIAITVKQIGAFSHRLSSMNSGDTLSASLPYGYFYSESAASTLVMLAAGIGIAPFRGMIMDALANNPTRKLVLCCSNRTEMDITFRNALKECSERFPNCSVNHFITREETAPEGTTKGRMSAPAVLQIVGSAPDPEFLLCGSISFVRDMWRDLCAASVPEEKIYTEAFFSH
ncbi:hypothetical protein HY090_02975 [Candidatus Kaiserbacteria bacterium]|nr:hypothetical protein [Candidatus Kaiserbacteria bacterium]